MGLASLEAIAGLARPVSLAGERVVPVLAELEPLLAGAGLRRGSVVTVAGSTSLVLALVAGASKSGLWCAALGMPTVGLEAAARLGVALDRFPLVTAPPDAGGWAWAAAALLDAVDVVVVATPTRGVVPAQTRRLAARARERAAVLVVAGGEWPGADVRLSVTASAWEGVGAGHGRLAARRVEVVSGGRGAAGQERRVTLWLPGPDGTVRPAPGYPAPGRMTDGALTPGVRADGPVPVGTAVGTAVG